MRKIALVFMLAVIAPSLVLGWLAVRSVRDQQIVVAQQQTLLYQGVTDALAKDVRDFIADRQRDFAQAVEALRRKHSSADLAAHFDALLRNSWDFADVGFAVSSDGSILSPSLFDRAEAQQFRLNNDRFLGSCEQVAVYWNSPKSGVDLKGDATPPVFTNAGKDITPAKSKMSILSKDAAEPPRLAPEEAEFKELIGNGFEGTVARFLQNKLKVLLWYRSVREPDIIYGAQLNPTNVITGIQPLVRPPEGLARDVRVALLNDVDRVIAGTGAGHPLVTTDIGHMLPHWRVALYLRSPDVLTRSARSLRLTLTLIVVVMISAIGLGSLLIVSDLKSQLRLARQKTDFVSNVSHELKTPLTSIRMFSELLAEGKAADENERRQFLGIINTEASRLTRLINNVLDFARMERGDNHYLFERCDLSRIVNETVAACRPQLEARGMSVNVSTPATPIEVRGDRDALAQVLVNLLSNAEKYSADGREVSVALSTAGHTAEIRVLDRGPGVPRGCEERIFDQFFRAHDSLSGGVQGCGLGLTLARQIARAHGGDVRYERRSGGGSHFIVALPLMNGHGAEIVRGNE